MKITPTLLEDTERDLALARDAGIRFMDMIGALPDCSDRTIAKSRAEEAIVYLQKMLDDLG